MKKIIINIVYTSIIGLISSSCSIIPKPISNEEVTKRINSDNKKIFSNQEDIKASLSLFDAIARGVKYNLDYKVELLEATSALLGYKAAFTDIFPDYDVSGNRIKRNNYYAQKAPEDNGFISTAQDKNRNVYTLDFSWNILDLGVSYYASKQKADDYYISKEKQKQILSKLVSDIRKYYWQYFAYLYVSNAINNINSEVNAALKDSEEASRERLTNMESAAVYQRDLLDKYSDLLQISTNLAESKYKLYSLMNLPLSIKFKLSSNQNQNGILLPKDMPKQITKLEEYSLYNRPELRKADYDSRISLNDVYKARVRMLPGLEFHLTDNYDSNSFLVNNKWHEISYGLTWNLIKLVSNYQRSVELQEKRKLVEMQRLALAASVITQVSISKINYLENYRQYEIRDKIYKANKEISDLEKKKNQANQSFKLRLLKKELDAIESKARMYLSYADVQTSVGEFLYSIGYNPVKNVDIAKMNLEEISNIIAARLTSFDNLNKGA